ncbi:MAG: FadR family transcriptional regulator [Gammaproteobacteria bacterium]|nr:FadR family transcriptional regulator [Gammaproteobacteria bacterium]
MFEPVGQSPAYRRVCEVIRGRILSRDLPEGAVLPTETELARQFEVNRSTVREALRQLQSNGLVGRRRGGKRLVVTRPTKEAVAGGFSQALALHEARVMDVCEALLAVEPGIAAAAARQRGDATVQRLRAAAQRFTGAGGDSAEAVGAVAEFFDALAAGSGNPVFVLLNEPLMGLLQPGLADIIDRVPQARRRIGMAQQQILQAVAAADADAAAAWMSRHVQDFRRGYEVAGLPLAAAVGHGPG